MIPKVIKNAADHAGALARVDALMDAATGSSEEAELEVWSLLIEKYETEHFPIPGPDPVSAIKFRVDQLGLDRADLLKFILSKSKISEVLCRRRPLSLPMIRALQRGLHLPAEVMIQEYSLVRASSNRRPAKRSRATPRAVRHAGAR